MTLDFAQQLLLLQKVSPALFLGVHLIMGYAHG